jgi:hypothetical protein
MLVFEVDSTERIHVPESLYFSTVLILIENIPKHVNSSGFKFLTLKNPFMLNYVAVYLGIPKIVLVSSACHSSVLEDLCKKSFSVQNAILVEYISL